MNITNIINRRGMILLALAFMAFGCPYESSVPLSPCNKAALDPALMGKWVSQPNGEDQTQGTLVFYAFNEHEYVVECSEEGEPKIDLYRAYATMIGESHFLNVQELGPKATARTWMFVDYSIASDTLKLRVMEEKIFSPKPPTSKALYRFLKKNLNHPELYDGKPIILNHVKSP